MSTTVASHTRLRPLYQGPKLRPSGLLPSLDRPTGSKVEGGPMRVSDLLRMELMAEERLRRMISTVACCHGAKLCAHADRAFPIATVQWPGLTLDYKYMYKKEPNFKK